jgi:transcriptional regulator with XRE-family HTH domain
MKQPQENDLSKLLERCRAERRLSLDEIAKAVGTSRQALSNIERGLSRPRRPLRYRLVEFLRKHGYFPKPEDREAEPVRKAS